MKGRRASLALLAVLSLGGLTACWDRKEVNDVAFVLGTAVDKEGSKYRLTVQVALPGQMGGAGSKGGGGGTAGGSKSWYLQTMTGDTLRAANQYGQRSNSRILYFAHRRSLMLGEELAKEGVSEVLDVVGRIPQNRMSTYVVVTRGKAADIMKASPPTEPFPSEMIRELVARGIKNPRTVKHFVNDLLTDGVDPIAPVIDIEKLIQLGKDDPKTNLRLDTTGIFRHDKLVGFLSTNEAVYLLMAMGELRLPELSTPAPKGGGKLTVQVQESAVSIEPVSGPDGVEIRLKYMGKASVVENLSKSRFSTEAELRQFEKSFAEQVKKGMEAVIGKLQKEYRADSIGFGKQIHNKMPGEWKKLSPVWEEAYPKLKVAVEIHMRIENIGGLLEPLGNGEGEFKG
ncbi:Ger(x)C family spore germination protein [Paenibacillus caseinilyticus]|uniref:Germination protein Ger(X)C n=1 Tax=Paenibacillus mucilaginosus K02 TaxID=997761 RepID=I0BMX9_9BACL|nr:Ger(x)C family spore germination protein [Paenibacillus mucilaginosus]AFH63726.2 hypothetical protein B2K_24075 [Paenibacillus mucilaginosus K02]